MSDSEDKDSVSPSLQVPRANAGGSYSFRITARASIATGRIRGSLDEYGKFNWDVVANIIQDALDDLERNR